MKKYPGNYQTLVHAHVYVHSVLQMINSNLGGTTQKLTIYRTEEGKRVALDPHLTLQESGYPGGPKNMPQDVALLYDYTTEFNDCPILTSDP